MRIAYLCMQPRQLGSASSAHVSELVTAMRELGASVDIFEVDADVAPTLTARCIASCKPQLRLIRRLNRFDALYVRMHPLALPTVLGARALRRMVAVEANGVPDDYTAVWPTLRRLTRLLNVLLACQLRLATSVFSVTPGIAAWASRVARRCDVVILPNGVDTGRFRPEAPRPRDVPTRYALYFGSLARWQGVEVALAAAQHPLWPPDLPLVVLGDGPLREEVSQAARLVPERIVYLGVRAHDQVPGYVAGASLTLALKNYHDLTAGQSALKVNESLASGTPVVAAPLRGTTDLPGVAAGVVVLPVVTAETVAATARHLLNKPDVVERMRRAGRTGVATRTWKDNARVVLDSLDK